jgi:hypothetical protein
VTGGAVSLVDGLAGSRCRLQSGAQQQEQCKQGLQKAAFQERPDDPITTDAVPISSSVDRSRMTGSTE